LTLTMGEPMEGKILRRCPRVIKVWRRGGDVFRSVNDGNGQVIIILGLDSVAVVVVCVD
jgi:hypothetical protein